MTTYQQCGQDVRDLCAKAMKLWHPDLDEHAVNCDLIFAHADVDQKTGMKKGPALRLGGYQCAAIVKVINLKDRAKGMGDAEIQIDGDNWPHWSEEQRMALLDHELEHLELVAKQGEVQFDDVGRPKLRIQLHDFQLGGFEIIAKRHGVHAFEVKMAHEMKEHFGQYLFDYEAPAGARGSVLDLMNDSGMVDAVAALCPDGKGVSEVTITHSGGGESKSVTLTPETGRRLRQRSRELKKERAA